MPPCNGVNFSESQEDYYDRVFSQKKTWAWQVNQIGTLVVFVIGFCGNILCLLVLCRRRLRRNSYTQYLIALAVVDTGAILAEVIAALNELHQNEYKESLIVHTNISCKLYYYVRYIFYSMSSWIIVALAIERLVAIRFPLWSKNICTVVNARRIILMILIFTMIIQSYHFVTKGLDCSSSSTSPPSKNCRCKTLNNSTYQAIDVFVTVYVWRLALMTLFPLTIIITVNVLIMSKLFNEGSLLDHTNTSCNAQRKMKLVYKISRMLVIVTTVYLILHVPGSSLDVIKYIYISVLKICNPKWQYYLIINNEIFDLLTNFNYGINFYLYIISGKHIRNELVRAFKHSSLRSKSSGRNGKNHRSSYYMSSYVHGSRYQPARYSNTPLSRRPTASSM
ncbi:unnamed protein product [Adineta steineri]|uniref:G-protein coupled receptors family 1 profile domain-containing protein n=1 Tax=Adineta steineri TaxID=433720 RepID=A0A818IFN3_9BILA|nr:unnamed protein product [Adineta steineri]CAF1227221.1 unnamed protein product [Adineta steineri]CAF3519150.1 unnamed protein product [Adineta steineri]CAF3543661.1 unnamed protein product [Adineta steineri]